MDKKIFIMAIVLAASTTGLRGQGIGERGQSGHNKGKSSFCFDMSKVTLGGNFGLGFGDGNTIINIAPQIGYFFTPRINAGAGVSYTYYKYDNDYGDKYNYFGINVFGRFYPLQHVVIHAQPEINYLRRSNAGGGSSELVPSFVVGAGVHFNYVTLMLQYDVAQSKYSPYGSNIFYSAGFSF